MIIAGNWKMNKTPQQAEKFMKELKSCMLSDKKQPQSAAAAPSSIILFLPAVYFYLAREIFSNSFIQWGGQNCFSKSFGSFTGENSPQVMKEMGAQYCLVGHSERRQLFSEDLCTAAEKFHAVLQHQMKPVLCVGETLEQRKNNQTEEVLESQLQKFKGMSHFLTAYEPVWAVGSGKSADLSQIQEAVQCIQNILENPSIPILYGGGVQPRQIKDLRAVQGLSGVLAGRSSLDLQEFLLMHQKSLEV